MQESNELRYDFEESVPPAPVEVRSIPQTELCALATRLMSTLGAEGIAIAVAIPTNPPSMICTMSCGDIAPAAGALLDINSGISGQCVREKSMLHSYDTATDSRVDKEACDRLGIRSLVVSPMLCGSTCVGVLEVFSTQPDAFDDVALSNIEEAAIRAASLIKVQEPAAELCLSQNSSERPALFLVDKRGRLEEFEPNTEGALEEAAVLDEESIELPKFLSLSPAPPRPRRWTAFAAAIATSASLGLILIRYLGASGTLGGNNSPAPGELAKGHSPSSVETAPIMSSLVSDATPQVRVLMAKAIAGNSNAQALLAGRYAAGNGVTRDAIKAAVWYVIAGVSGNKEASGSAVRLMQILQPFEIEQVHFNLGTMFRDGIGTSRNLIAAYSWFSLAQAAGDVRARAAVLNLEQVMKPAEVAEGRRRAVAWIDSHRAPARGY